MSGAVTAYTNDGTGTVTTGGTTAPAGGTVESWTVNATTAFPVASASATPPTQFLCADRALPAEKFLVTVGPGGTGSAQSWTVTRGAENTTPVAHTAGFTIDEVTTAGGLGQLARVDWLNAATIFGADPAGTADSTSAIQAALNACPVGGCVYLPQGTYKVTAPLTLPTGVRLMGASRGFGIPIGNYGIGGLPVIGSILKPASTFSGAAVISMTSTSTPQLGGQQIIGVTIDCSSLTAAPTVHGIQITNGVAGVTMRDVLAYGGNGASAGNGLHVIPGANATPDFFDVAHCKFSGWGGQGIHLAGIADSYFVAVESTGNTGDAWNITNGNNSRFLGCKGEGSSAGWGWNITGASGFTGYANFTACTSGSNSSGGFQVGSTGTGTFRFANISATDTAGGLIAASGNTNTILTDQPNTYEPADLGFQAWTQDPAILGSGSTNPTAGTVYLSGIAIKTPCMATGIRIYVKTAGATLTANQCFVGLYNSAGTRVGVSADQSGSWTTSNTPVDAALTGGPFALQPGLYWVGFVANGTTTPLIGQPTSSGSTAFPQGRNSAATYRYATNGTAQTSLATSITPSSNAAYGNVIWAAIY